MNELINQLCREYEAGFNFKQGRVKDWKSTEDLYLGKVKQNIKGRINIPIPIMSGFIDTLVSKIDEPPDLQFKGQEEADYRKAEKVQAMYGQDKQGNDDDDTDWHSKDIDNKKIASMYGRAIFKAYGESAPKYRFNLSITDPYDFYIDPKVGGNMEAAGFLGEDCVFKTKEQLIAGAQGKRYISQAVANLLNGTKEDTIVNNDDMYQNKVNRFSALNLNNQMYNYSAHGLYRLVESGTIYKGVRYYCLWSYEGKQVVRAEPLKPEMFKSGLWWWTSWAPYRDAFTFWNKAPSDDVRPLAESIRVLLNQEMENRQKTNWNLRAYDPNMFTDPSELEYRPGGLARVNSEYVKTHPIEKGIYQFTTPLLNGTIDLVQFLDQMLGTKTGINAGAQGQSEDTKVGIYYGNIQQVADRLGLMNKSYVSCWRSIGRRYVWSLKEHLPAKQAVKIIGRKGIEWDFLVKEEVNPDVDIIVKSTSAEAQQDALKQKQRSEALASITAAYAGRLNPDWVIEQELMNAGYDADEVKQALDVDYYGNREILIEAAEAIDMIVNGKEPKINRGANVAYVQKILDYAKDNTDGDDELFKKLVAFGDAHYDIVIENLGRKLILPQPAMEGAPPVEGAMPQPEGGPMPGTPMETSSVSQKTSQMLQPDVMPTV